MADDRRPAGLAARGHGDLRVAEAILVGVLALDWATWPWNRQKPYLYNQHFWVEPIWRSGGTATRLLQAAKALAQERGVPLLIETSMLDADTGKKERFIEKNGLQRIGGKFIFTPNQSM